MVTFHMARVVVVALVERDVPLACVVVKGAVRGCAALAAPQDGAVQALLGRPKACSRYSPKALLGGR